MHETLCDRDMKDLNDLKRVLVNSDLRYLKIDQIPYPIWGNCPEGLGIWTPFPLPKLQGNRSELEGVGWPRWLKQ